MIFCPYRRAPSQSCMYKQTPMAWYIMCSMYTLLSSNTQLIFSWLSSQISRSSLGGAVESRNRQAWQFGEEASRGRGRGGGRRNGARSYYFVHSTPSCCCCCCEVTSVCPTLCDPRDSNPPGSPVPGRPQRQQSTRLPRPRDSTPSEKVNYRKPTN